MNSHTIYLLFHVAFNSQGHIAMGGLQVEETSAYCTVNHWQVITNFPLCKQKKMFKVNIHASHYFYFLDQVDRTPFKSTKILPSDAEDTKVVKSKLTVLNNIKKDNWVAIVVSVIGYLVIMLFYTIKLFCHLKVKQQCGFKKNQRQILIPMQFTALCQGDL